MNYAAPHRDFGSCLEHAVAPKRDAVAKKIGVLRRIVDAILAFRQREADRDLARMLTRSGRSLTDSLERTMMEHWSPPN